MEIIWSPKIPALKRFTTTLPETNELPMKIPMFPCKYRQNGGFSMAMLVLGRVTLQLPLSLNSTALSPPWVCCLISIFLSSRRCFSKTPPPKTSSALAKDVERGKGIQLHFTNKSPSFSTWRMGSQVSDTWWSDGPPIYKPWSKPPFGRGPFPTRSLGDNNRSPMVMSTTYPLRPGARSSKYLSTWVAPVPPGNPQELYTKCRTCDALTWFDQAALLGFVKIPLHWKGRRNLGV